MTERCPPAGLQKDHEQKRLNVKRQEGFRRSLAAQMEEAEQRKAAQQLAKQAEAQKLVEDAHKYQVSHSVAIIETVLGSWFIFFAAARLPCTGVQLVFQFADGGELAGGTRLEDARACKENREDEARAG